MKEEALPQRPSRWIRALNIVTLVSGCWTGLVLLFMAWDRQPYVMLSDSIYGSSAPIMNSRVADLLMHKWFAIVIGVVVAGLIVKEFVANPIRKRLWINVVSLVCLMAVTLLLMHLLSVPISHFSATS